MGAEADNTLADSPPKTNENLRALTHTDIRSTPPRTTPCPTWPQHVSDGIKQTCFKPVHREVDSCLATAAPMIQNGLS